MRTTESHSPDLLLTVSVSFSTPDESTLKSLTKSLLELERTVITPEGKKAIKSFKGGKQTSVEGHEKGMKVVFLLEFEVCLNVLTSSAMFCI